MDDVALGPAVNVDLVGPMPSLFEATYSGKVCICVFWDWVEREGKGCVDVLRASRDCSEVLKTELMASYLVLSLDE